MKIEDILVLGYLGIAGILFIISAIIVYLVCIEEKGLVFGGTIGLIPSVVIAAIFAILWPISFPIVLFKIADN